MPGAAFVIAEYEEPLTRTETLVRELQPSLSVGTVIATVRSFRNELLRSGVRRDLAIAADAMARTRLNGKAVPNQRKRHQTSSVRGRLKSRNAWPFVGKATRAG